jgi:hypothetical protein
LPCDGAGSAANRSASAASASCLQACDLRQL